MKFSKNYWALILGGSSGFGLATAKKLSQHGMNICIVHRDRKGNMGRIQPEFDAIIANEVELVTYNVNALAKEEIQYVLKDLKEKIGVAGKIRMLLHSIAYGNLKLLAPQRNPSHNPNFELIQTISASLGVSAQDMQNKIDELFIEGASALMNIATPPSYDNQNLLEDEDFALTLHSMGASLASWVKAVFQHELFAEDARVLALTSEGNEISWRGYAAVSAAKVALEAIARSIAVEYAPYGIRANIIQAGVTDTPALRLIPGNTHLKASAINRNPYKRLTTPKDVANFIYLMCLEEASWANGNVIRVDGGEHISG